MFDAALRDALQGMAESEKLANSLGGKSELLTWQCSEAGVASLPCVLQLVFFRRGWINKCSPKIDTGAYDAPAGLSL